MTEWKERCYATHCGCCFLNLYLRDQPKDVLLSYSSLEKEIWTEESSGDTREWVVFRCQARFPRCEEVRETQSRQKFRPVTNKMSPRSRNCQLTYQPACGIAHCFKACPSPCKHIQKHTQTHTETHRQKHTQISPVTNKMSPRSRNYGLTYQPT